MLTHDDLTSGQFFDKMVSLIEMSNQNLQRLSSDLKIGVIHEDILHKNHVKWNLDSSIVLDAFDLLFNLLLSFNFFSLLLTCVFGLFEVHLLLL